MAAVTAASGGGYAYALIHLRPGSHNGDASTFAFFIGVALLGVPYALWTAVLNRSIVIALLWSTDVFLAVLVGFFVVRGNWTQQRPVSLALGAVMELVLLYPWANFERMLRTVRAFGRFALTCEPRAQFRPGCH